jgi:hypothetical protein
MSLNIQTPDPNQALVFDVADPDRHGVVVKAGSEVSEVRYDDGAVRHVANDRLRTVEAVEVELDNPTLAAEPPVPVVVRQGQEAWQRLSRHSTWEDWKQVGAALVVGRAEAMRDGHVNKPKGRSYNAAISAFLKKFGFNGLDKADRSRLLDVMDHQSEVEGWLSKLESKERQRLNHPASVCRPWKASLVVPDPNAPPKVSPVQKLKDSLIDLQEENYRMKRALERGAAISGTRPTGRKTSAR